ncbi:MAG TPA: alpha/beta fold hydrolase, partial [Pyrinomonadaceae bacterium]|nr:alpha/beta fold hydrolase [Pyrinomonadaceae bacterium]
MFFTDSYKALRRGERRRALTLMMLSVLTIALIALPVGFFMLRRFETSVTFHPERAPWGGSWSAPRGGEDVWFRAADGSRLHGWFIASETRPAAATVVYLHGNGGNVSYVGWVGEQLAARGFDVLLFDYRGYGRSEGAVSDERGIYKDADAAYDFVVRERGVKPERLVLYGQSLGTTAAAELAAERPCGALVLESGL